MSLARAFTRLYRDDAVIEQKLDRIITLLEKTIMGQLEDLASALDAETNALAAKIDRLSSELTAAQANNQAPKPETLAALQAVSDRLKALGADPAQPIPPAPAADAATPGT